jgi:hypothetical protein
MNTFPPIPSMEELLDPIGGQLYRLALRLQEARLAIGELARLDPSDDEALTEALNAAENLHAASDDALSAVIVLASREGWTRNRTVKALDLHGAGRVQRALDFAAEQQAKLDRIQAEAAK